MLELFALGHVVFRYSRFWPFTEILECQLPYGNLSCRTVLDVALRPQRDIDGSANIRRYHWRDQSTLSLRYVAHCVGSGVEIVGLRRGNTAAPVSSRPRN